MRIDSIDFFYAAMPEITLEADGSQDALLVRVVSDSGHFGWGECEASPLVSIAAFVTPRSHGVCQPVSASVLGRTLDSPRDIRAITMDVERNSMDLLQAPHTFSGIEMALWDLLGRARDTPVWRLLGYDRVHAKTPYASLLFGATPHETLQRGRDAVARGFQAVKFGWEAFGHGEVGADADHLHAAREGIGSDAHLLVDAGQVWREDVEAAASRIAPLTAVRATWLEEPFFADAYAAHSALAARSSVGLAGGEGAHNVRMAQNLLEYGDVSFVQIDTGRIGGIGPAKVVADMAVDRGVTYVNHTFTSHLALSASLQPFAGLADHSICEYPAHPKRLANEISSTPILQDADGRIHVPDRPGLGIEVATESLRPYLRDVRISVDGISVFESTDIGASSVPTVQR